MSQIKTSENRRLLICVYTALFAIMLLFNFMTPMMADDFSYSFSFDEDVRIESIGQILPSMQAHREVMNGRVFSHALAQFFLMLPKAVFNIVNSLHVLLVAYLFSRYFKSGKNCSALLLFCGAALIWVLLPAFGHVFFWLTGSFNYIWSISIFLIFIMPFTDLYLGRGGKRPLWREILSVIFAFVAGAYSENGSIAAIFIALCVSLLIYIKDRRIPAARIIALLFSFAGFAFLMSAPATSTRAGSFALSTIAANLRNIFSMSSEYLTVLYMMYAVLFILCLQAGADKRVMAVTSVFILAGIGSLAAFTFAIYIANRHFCFTIFFAVLANLMLMDQLILHGRRLIPCLISVCAAVPLVFNMGLALVDNAVIFGQSLEREAAINKAISSSAGSVVIEQYLPSTKYSAAYKIIDAGPDPDVWPNVSMAMYYGLDSVTGYVPDGQ